LWQKLFSPKLLKLSMDARVVNSKKKNIPVKIVEANPFHLALLKRDENEFILPYYVDNEILKYGKVFVAVDKNLPTKVLAYLTLEFLGTKKEVLEKQTKANVVRMSARIGYNDGRIGQQLYGRVRAHLQRIGVKQIKVGFSLMESVGFYEKKLKMKKINNPKALAFKQELTFNKRARAKRKSSPTVLAPHNLMNPDGMIKRRLAIRRR